MSIHGLPLGERTVLSSVKGRDLLAALMPAPQAPERPGVCTLVLTEDGSVLSDPQDESKTLGDWLKVEVPAPEEPALAPAPAGALPPPAASSSVAQPEAPSQPSAVKPEPSYMAPSSSSWPLLPTTSTIGVPQATKPKRYIAVVPDNATLYLVPCAKSALPSWFPLPVDDAVWLDDKQGDAEVRVHIVARNETVMVKVRSPKSAGLGVAPLPGDTLNNLKRKLLKAAGIPVASQSLWLNNSAPLTDAGMDVTRLVGGDQTVYVYTVSAPSGSALLSAARRNFVTGALNCLETQTPHGIATYMVSRLPQRWKAEASTTLSRIVQVFHDPWCTYRARALPLLPLSLITSQASLYLLTEVHAAGTFTASASHLLGRLYGLTHNVLLVNLLARVLAGEELVAPQHAALAESLFVLFRRIMPRSPQHVAPGVGVGDHAVFQYSNAFWAYIVATAEEADGLLLDTESAQRLDFYRPSLAILPGEDEYRVLGTASVPDGAAPTSGAPNALWPGALQRKHEEDDGDDEMGGGGAGVGMGAGKGASSSSSASSSGFSAALSALWGRAATSDSGLTQYFPEPHVPQSWSYITSAGTTAVHARFAFVPVINLKSSLLVKPLLTRNTLKGGLPVVNLHAGGSGEDVSRSLLWDPTTGVEWREDPQVLVQAEKRMDALLSTGSTTGFTRAPREAIMIVLDTSGSMNELAYPAETTGLGGTITRIEAVKEMFVSFSNRTAAYDLPHV